MATAKAERPTGPTRRGAKAWVAVVALATVLASCGGEPSADAPETTIRQGSEDGGGEAAAVTEPTTATTAAVEEGTGEEPETLADYLGFDYDDPDAAAAQSMEYERRIQDLIARCMAEEGFEYVPAVRPLSSSGFTLDEETFAREQGFGITTWYGQANPFDSTDDRWVDPNYAIVEALSDSERDAYQRVLFGSSLGGSDEAGAAVDEQGANPFGEGCRGEAFEAVYGALEEVWRQLGPKFEELSARMEADPRFQEANRGWAVCMADRGYRYDSAETMYEEVYDDFGRRLEEIVGSDSVYEDPFEGWTEEEIETFMAEKSDEEIDDFFTQASHQRIEEVDQEALAVLQQEERDLAVANFECGEALAAVTEEVWKEYEQRFVEENREVLEQLRT